MRHEKPPASAPLVPHLNPSLLPDIYRDLLESFADGAAVLTPDGLIVDMDQHSLDSAQIQREKVTGKPLTDFPSWSYDPAVQQQLHKAIEQAASKGDIVRFEARLRSKPGIYLDMVMTITPHCDANNQVMYLLCTGRDITERKRAEKELRTLVESIPHFVWIMRPDGSAEYANQPWCDYTNLTAEQLQGNGWVQIFHPDDRHHVLETWQTSVRTGTPYEVIHRIRNGKTGEYRWFLARGKPFRNRWGTIQYWLGTCTDIDEQKRAEQRLKESEESWPKRSPSLSGQQRQTAQRRILIRAAMIIFMPLLKTSWDRDGANFCTRMIMNVHGHFGSTPLLQEIPTRSNIVSGMAKAENTAGF